MELTNLIPSEYILKRLSKSCA